MATHRLCSGCHRRRNPKYPKAKSFRKCHDCHSAQPEEVMIFGNELKLYFKVNLAGGGQEGGKLVEEYMKENYDLLDFILVKENEAEVRLYCDIQVKEKFDDRLIAEASGMRMFKGICRMRMFHNKTEIYHTFIESKIISGRDVNEIHKIILNFLAERIFRASKVPLERIVEE